MDIPRMVAEWLALNTGINAEPEPSPADIKNGHWVVSVASFWLEPQGTWAQDFEKCPNGDKLSFEQNVNPLDYGATMALPLEVTYKSRGTGEQWRGEYLEQARKNVLFLQQPRRITVAGGKITGKAAEMVANHVADFDNLNIEDPNALGFLLGLERAPGKDRAFEKVFGKNEKINGYIAEQVFTGELIYTDAITEEL